VSSPAISVAVVIDTPTVGSLYGTTVSAPVFREVAQEVLEYLGVPHDQALKTPTQMLQAQNSVATEDGPEDQIADMTSMFDEVNSLPADDPLRAPANAAAMAQNQSADQAFDAAAKNRPKQSGLSALPDKVLAQFHKNGNTTSVMPDGVETVNERVEAPVIRPQVQARANGGVVVDPGKRVAVPEFHGANLRMVVEHAGNIGLRVQTLGSGLAQEQAPAAGTMVPVGTAIVVRFAR
jgi:cell division protein FtsI (penicillin-binding protein 3)